TEGLASAWAGQPDLAGVAQALRSEDPQAVERAVADLAARADQMTDERRQQLQIALQAGANAARDLPDVAAPLRRAAQVPANSRAGQAGQGEPNAQNAENGQGGQSGQQDQSGAASAAIRDLSAPLAQGAARAAGAQGAQQALSGLNDVRASLGTL